MEALILAAGLGTRLRPLTDSRPKALVEIDGHSLLEIAINKAIYHGCRHIVVNTHHFAEMMKDYISSHHWEADIDISDESAMLLDTGGALKKASSLFSGRDNILVHNVDVVSRIDLNEMERQHVSNNNLATLAVSRRITNRMLIIDKNGLLQGRTVRDSGETTWVTSPQSQYETVAFSGITLLTKELMDLLPPADHPFPIIPEYLHLAAEKRIGTFFHPSSIWLDVGKPESLPQAASIIHPRST